MQGNDRLWSSEDIDLHGQKAYRVDNLPVLNLTTLGPSVIKSSIQQLGVVQNLETEGNLNANGKHTCHEANFYVNSSDFLKNVFYIQRLIRRDGHSMAISAK